MRTVRRLACAIEIVDEGAVCRLLYVQMLPTSNYEDKSGRSGSRKRGVLQVWIALDGLSKAKAQTLQGPIGRLNLPTDVTALLQRFVTIVDAGGPTSTARWAHRGPLLPAESSTAPPALSFELHASSACCLQRPLATLQARRTSPAGCSRTTRARSRSPWNSRRRLERVARYERTDYSLLTTVFPRAGPTADFRAIRSCSPSLARRVWRGDGAHMSRVRCDGAARQTRVARQERRRGYGHFGRSRRPPRQDRQTSGPRDAVRFDIVSQSSSVRRHIAVFARMLVIARKALTSAVKAVDDQVPHAEH